MSYSAKPLIFRSRKGFDIVIEPIVKNENVFSGITDTLGPVTGLQTRVVAPRTIPLFKMEKLHFKRTVYMKIMSPLQKIFNVL